MKTLLLLIKSWESVKKEKPKSEARGLQGSHLGIDFRVSRPQHVGLTESVALVQVENLVAFAVRNLSAGNSRIRAAL